MGADDRGQPDGLLYMTHADLPHLLTAAEDSLCQVADIVDVSSIAGRVGRRCSGARPARTPGRLRLSRPRHPLPGRARLLQRLACPVRRAHPLPLRQEGHRSGDRDPGGAASHKVMTTFLAETPRTCVSNPACTLSSPVPTINGSGAGTNLPSASAFGR